MLQVHQALVSAGLSLQCPLSPVGDLCPSCKRGASIMHCTIETKGPQPGPCHLVPPAGMGTWPPTCCHASPAPRPAPTHAPAMAAYPSVCLQPVQLSGCSSGQAVVQGKPQLQLGLRQPCSALPNCGNVLLPLLFFFLFAHLLRIVAAAKIKYRVSV